LEAKTFEWALKHQGHAVKVGLKSVERIFQELPRAFDWKVSCLINVCIQRIKFESVKGLLSCLRTILDDSDIVIVQIKNGYDPELCPKESAGLRTVIISLRIDVELTRQLGIETHICEMQLILDGIWKEAESIYSLQDKQHLTEFLDFQKRKHLTALFPSLVEVKDRVLSLSSKMVSNFVVWMNPALIKQERCSEESAPLYQGNSYLLPPFFHQDETTALVVGNTRTIQVCIFPSFS